MCGFDHCLLRCNPCDNSVTFLVVVLQPTTLVTRSSADQWKSAVWIVTGYPPASVPITASLLCDMSAAMTV